MGTRGAALRGNTAKSGCRISSGGSGGGVYVEGGATFTQGKGVVSGNTAGDGEDVFKQ
jgi:hypothetical protein